MTTPQSFFAKMTAPLTRGANRNGVKLLSPHPPQAVPLPPRGEGKEGVGQADEKTRKKGVPENTLL